jgi:two-component system, cell cycle sensor histidine kinase and response regulator CckA
MPDRSRPDWLPLRSVALLVAVASGVWEFATGATHDQHFPTMLAIRLGAAGGALLVALLSSPRRSTGGLRWLAFLLGLDIALTSSAICLVLPVRAWETTALLTAVILGSALFVPWSWRWQAAFAAIITAAGAVTFLLISDTNFPIPAFDETADTILLTVAVASVLGARLASRERVLVAGSEARYRALFQESGDAIAVLDPHGAILDANPRFVILVARPLDEILGVRIAELLVPARAQARITEEIPLALEGQLRTITDRVRRHDGVELEVEMTFASVGGPKQPLVQAILRDRTEHRALERRQVQAQRLDALARLAGGIAHQFNNLLGGILTHASVLREDPVGEGASGAIDEILAAARRGRDLTKQVLQLTNPAELRLRPTAVGELIERVATLARTVLPKGVRLETPPLPPLPPLRADPDHLADACYELALNARDAMRSQPSGVLTIRANAESVTLADSQWPDATPGSYVRLSVEDTGVGMDAATLERVLEPFFTTKPMHQASGLGLASVYGVARDHGGSVRITSRPGRGTTVELLIPVSTAAESAPVPAAASTPTRGAVILVVDDEEIVRNSLRRSLTRFGHKVIEAGDGPSALTALQSASPAVDLVILDLVLPGGGAGILELLRAIRPGLKVLISSGYSPDNEIVKGIGTRANGFLQKPFELAELREAVARALDAPR